MRRYAHAAVLRDARRPLRDARHQQAEVLRVGLLGPPLAGDAAGAQHDDPIGERENLVELDRNQEHRLAGVALGDDAAVDEFDRADIDAARRLANQHDARLMIDFARQHQLLLIAAGEIGGLEQRIARADVEGAPSCDPLRR